MPPRSAIGQTRLAAEPIPGADPGREDDHVGGQLAAVGELGDAHRAVVRGAERGRAHAGAHLDALVLDEQAQHLPAAVVELDGHEPIGELDHGGCGRRGPAARRRPRGRAPRRRRRRR
jgi:hypothetical protein